MTIFLTRISLCTRPRITAYFLSIIWWASRSGRIIFPFQTLILYIKTEYLKTFVHLWAFLLRLPPHSPRLASLLGASAGVGACALSSALPRTVFPQTLSLFVALSVGGVLGGGALLRRSSISTGVLLGCPLLAGIVGYSSVLPPLNPVWRPFARTRSSTSTLALLRPGVPHALALSIALSAGGVLGSCALQCFFGPTRLSPQLLWKVADSSSLSKLCFPL